VRGTFALSEGLLTLRLFRLNGRELILERSANLHPETPFYMASFGTTQQKGTNRGSMSQPTTISVSQPKLPTMDDASCKYNSKTEPKLPDIEKLVRSLHFDAVSAHIIIFIEGGRQPSGS
jgi:hypothetical protein